MRRGKHYLWLLTLFLALGVAAREAPEIVSLTDDISNEGTVVGFEDPLPELASRRLFRVERLQATSAESFALVNLKQRSCPIPPLVLSTDAGKGLLQFLSTQRT